MNKKDIAHISKDKKITVDSPYWLRMILNRTIMSSYDVIEKEEHKENLNMTILCQNCYAFLSLFQCIQIKEFEYYIKCNICENYFRLEVVLILVENEQSQENLQKEIKK